VSKKLMAAIQKDAPDMAEIAQLAQDQFDGISGQGQRIIAASDLLLSLVNDLLDWAKAEGSELKVTPEVILANDVAVNIVDEMKFQAQAKGLSLICMCAPARVMADPARLRQVIYNLVGNAIKFTPKGTITVTVRNKGQRVIIGVEDTGVGIAQENIDMIFERFKQVDGSDTRSFGGFGLGLTIARKIVELHGGRLTVTSKVGEGSRFWFELEVPVVRGPRSRASRLSQPVHVFARRSTRRRAYLQVLEAMGAPARATSDVASLAALSPRSLVLAPLSGPQDPDLLGLARACAQADLRLVVVTPAAARAAVRAAPDDPQAALQLGVMLLELGCRREPEALLERAYAAGLEAAAVRLAHLCALDGDLQPARFWLARAAPSPATSVTQGYVLYKERRHGEAAQVLREAIGAGGLGADLPRAQLFLGKALHENLRDQEAVPVLEAVVRDWPDTTFAGAALHTLQHIRNPVHGHTH
ncbi:MAG: hypothetical protein KDC48_18035, partial [Planctomycetes bacterium]|nr:hypothetical protein [Planctomycetota bacterium]